MSTLHSIAGPSGIDVRRYGRLLAKFTPKVIQTEDENEESLAVVESLMKRGDANLTAEEETLLNPLGHLIEEFERRTYRRPEGDPAGVLQAPMDGRNLKAATRRRTRIARQGIEITLENGRSAKEQAETPGRSFWVSPVKRH